MSPRREAQLNPRQAVCARCGMKLLSGVPDRVEYHMQRITRRKKMWWYRGEAKVDGALACEAEVGAMIAED